MTAKNRFFGDDLYRSQGFIKKIFQPGALPNPLSKFL